MSQSAKRKPQIGSVVVSSSWQLLQYRVVDWLMHSRQFHHFVWLTWLAEKWNWRLSYYLKDTSYRIIKKWDITSGSGDERVCSSLKLRVKVNPLSVLAIWYWYCPYSTKSMLPGIWESNRCFAVSGHTPKEIELTRPIQRYSCINKEHQRNSKKFNEWLITENSEW